MIMGSVLMFSLLNVLVKAASAHYPTNEVTFFRNALALLPVSIMVALHGGVASLRTTRPLKHASRAVIGLCSMLLMFWSLDLLPLADAVAINFAAPLFLTALSVPLLGEKVGIHRWSAVAIGFVGVLVMVRPSGDILQLGALVGLGGAFMQAFAMVTIRQLTSTEAPDTTVFYFTFLSACFMATSLPFSWVWPQGFADWALLCGTGLVGGCGQLFLTRAYSLAPPATVAPFNYGSILVATFFGWLLWEQIPEPHVVAGGAIVIASGLYILYRETVRRSSLVAAPSAAEAD